MDKEFNQLVELYKDVKNGERPLVAELEEHGFLPADQGDSLWCVDWKREKAKREERGDVEDEEYDAVCRAVELCENLAELRWKMARIITEPFLAAKNYRFDVAGRMAFHAGFNGYVRRRVAGRLNRDDFLGYQRYAIGDVPGSRALVDPSLFYDYLLNDEEGRAALRWHGENVESDLFELAEGDLSEDHVKALNFADYDPMQAEASTWLYSAVFYKQKDLYAQMARSNEGHNSRQWDIVPEAEDENVPVPPRAVFEDKLSGNAFDPQVVFGDFGERAGDAKAVFLRHSLDYARLDGLCRDAEIQQKRIVDFFREMVSKKSSIQDVASSLESKKARKKKSGKALSKNIGSWRTLYTFDLISVLNIGSDIRAENTANNGKGGTKVFYYLDDDKRNYRLLCVLSGSIPTGQGLRGFEAYANERLRDFRCVVDWDLVDKLLEKRSLAAMIGNREAEAKIYQFDSIYMRRDEFFAAGVGRDPVMEDKDPLFSLTEATKKMLSNVPNVSEKLKVYMKKRRALFKELGYKPMVNAHCEDSPIDRE